MKRYPLLYRGWTIEGRGGFITIRHFLAEKGGSRFWDFELRALKKRIDAIEEGRLEMSDIPELFKKPLYI